MSIPAVVGMHHVRQLVKDEDLVCLLYTSDAADERSSVDFGGRRIIIKKKKKKHTRGRPVDNSDDYV